jgi:hypothetical protein
MSYLLIALNLIRAAIQSEFVHAVGSYAIRQGAEAVIRQIRSRSAPKKRTQRIS